MTIPTLFSYLPFEEAVALCKYAAGSEVEEGPTVEPTPPPPPAPAAEKPSILKTLGAHAAGFGLGTAGGFAGAALANKGYQYANGGKNIPLPYLLAAAPVVGGGLGLAYTLAKAHEQEELRRALTNTNHGPGGRPPRG